MPIEDKKTKIIDGVTYEVSLLPAPIGRKLLMDLKRIIGPAIAELLSNTSSTVESLGDMDVTNVSGAIARISQDVSSDFYSEVYSILASKTKFSRDGIESVDLRVAPDHFMGRYLSEMKWIAFALEVNYSDFLSAVQPIASHAVGAVRKARSVSTSPNGSIGMPGESSQTNE